MNIWPITIGVVTVAIARTVAAATFKTVFGCQPLTCDTIISPRDVAVGGAVIRIITDTSRRRRRRRVDSGAIARTVAALTVPGVRRL